MRLSLLYSARKLFLEYSGFDFGRINLDTALNLAHKDATTLIAIQCPSSGHWAKKLNRSGMHSQLIQAAVNDGIRDAWFALRAYWIPATGKLMLYQMETPSGHMVDPLENVIDRLAYNLGVNRDIMSIDIIE